MTAKSVIAVLALVAMSSGSALAAPAIQISDIQVVPSASVARYEKIEISFTITGSSATFPQWPYDPSPPSGVPTGVGLTVNAVFTDPQGQQYAQPAFYAEQFIDQTREGRDWHLPTGIFGWRVRFSPNRVGLWFFKIVATDQNGTFESVLQNFIVTPSSRKGFIRPSAADSRYFEFDDGTLFNGVGFEFPDTLGDPTTTGAPAYETLGGYGVNFVRVWISSIFGSAWMNWIGGRNQYRGYLPVQGLVPYTDPTTNQTSLVMQMDYESAGDIGWFDACRMQFWDGLEESIKPNTAYRIRVTYSAAGVTGPRNPSFPNYGLVAKLGGWHANCYEPGTSTPVTNYGRNISGFSTIEGTWFSGSNNFLPRMHLGLENVQQGWAFVRSVSVREDLGGGSLGPEIMITPSVERQLYVPEERAYSMDKVVENAERNGVFLKLVLMDVNDEIYQKMADDGSWVMSEDNLDGLYGLGRGMNKTRWLQQVWWRYLQARWGYSPSIHSWEFTNEGDPSLSKHYEAVDELGKYMHCRVFGVEPGSGDGARCTLQHPNAHMVTTSFWAWFPAPEFWMNSKYPNVDYADVHAYVSTSFAPLPDRQLMQWDAAYYHLWHSQHVASLKVGKPVVRGEGGLDAPDNQSESVLGLSRDATGVWLHNFLWSALDGGGLYEIYWWNTHIWDAGYDHRGAYRAIRNFLDDVPLNRGGYVDWGGSVTNPALRVAGQKNAAAGSLYLWVQNRQHTWKNVVDGVPIAPASGEIVIPGLTPGATFSLDWWDTYTPGGRILSTETLTADSGGSLRIVIAPLVTDLALKILNRSAPAPVTNVRIVR